MEKLWLNDDSVSCIHPSQKLRAGFDEVLGGFKGMFATMDELEKGGGMVCKGISVKDVRLSVKGTAAWISCVEVVEYGNEKANSEYV